MNKFEQIKELEEKRDAKTIEFNCLFSQLKSIQDRLYQIRNEIKDIDHILFDLYDESEESDV